MEQFKRAQVIILPTENNTGIIVRWNNELSLNTKKQDSRILTQHLYIISDDEAKENDLYIESNHKGFGFIKYKIIATTDTSLKVKTYYEIEGNQEVNLPQPSEQFIEKYIEEYNKGNIITDVLVEYEYLLDDNTVIPYWKLKVNPKDNTITIKKLKDNWNRKEVIGLLRDILSTDDIHIARYPDGSVADVDDEDFNNWITKNL